MKCLKSLVAFLFLLPLTSLFAAAPPNDGFASAFPLASNNSFTTGSNVGATTEAGEPLVGGGIGTGSIWYTWTPTTTNAATIETNGSDFDTVLAVYTGTTPAALTQVGFSDDDGIAGRSRAVVNVTSGVTYHISVTGKNGASGNVVLATSFSTDVGKVIYAPAETDVVEGATAQLTFYRIGGTNGAGNATFSFQFTAGASAADFGAFSPTISFAAGANTATVAVPTVDDGTQEADEGAFVILAVGTLQTFPLLNREVVIFDNDHPANDSVLNAVPLTGASGTFNFNNNGASPDGVNPAYKAAGLREHSVWYQWTAPETASYSWNFPSGQTLGAFFFTGNPATSLVAYPSQQFFAPPSPVTTQMFATAGQTFYFLVDDLVGQASGSGTVTWAKNTTGYFSLDGPTTIGYVNQVDVAIPVHRVGGTTGSATISYTITPLTTTANQISNDTQGGGGPLTGLLFFQGGSSDDQFIFVGINNGGNLTPGETFKVDIQAPSFTGTVLSSTVVSIYDNDRFAEAGPISGATGNVEVLLNSFDATVEPGEPAHGPDGITPAQTATVWFDWVAPSTGVFIFESDDASEEQVEKAYFSIYTGDTLNTLVRTTPLPTVLGETEARQALLATAGTHYKIGVRESKESAANGQEEHLGFLSWFPGSTITFDQSAYTVSEAQGTLTLTFNRTGDLSTFAGFRLKSEDITTDQFDYTPVDTVIDFGPGDSVETFVLHVTADHLHEVTESLRLNVTDQSDNGYLPTTSVNVDITSADAFVNTIGTFSAVIRAGGTAATQGTVTITTAAGGKFTGKLTYGGKTFSFKGVLDANGTASVTVPKAGTGTVVLNLKSTGGANRFNLTLTDGANTGTANVDIHPYDGKNNLAPSFGTYTARLDAADTATAPGFATVTVGLNGAVKVVGCLADGTAFTSATSLSVVPDFGLGSPAAPLYVPLYKNGGFLSGNLNFDVIATPGQTLLPPVSADLAWFKPVLATEKFYPVAIDTQITVAGSRYNPPLPNQRAFPGLADNGELTITLAGPGLPVNAISSAKCYWLINNLVSTGLFTNPKLSLKVAAKTGLVTGTVTIPGTKPTLLPVKAIILQGSGELAGFYLHGPSKTSGAITGAK